MASIFLHTAEASLVFEQAADSLPQWRFLGAKVDSCGLASLADERAAASFSLDADVPFAMAPPAGWGWFGPAAVAVRRAGLPLSPVFAKAVFRHGPEGVSVVVHDAAEGLELTQSVTVSGGGAFEFAAQLRNTGTARVQVDWLASLMVPLGQTAQQILSWRGRHNAELVAVEEPLPQHGWVREGRRGISGHGGPPALVVLHEGATRHHGLVHALQLAWSGDSRIAIERDDEGYWILSAGCNLVSGPVELAPGETFQAPVAILAISTGGRNGAMQQQHAAVRERIRWPTAPMQARKVHLNSWEACYFDHDETRIAALAKAAAAIGIERFVLDDGWFKGRNDDRAGLGDWTCDPVKYPHGLKPLAEQVRGLGMEFGLWVEPEMANPDSDLLRVHPEWALGAGQGPTARNQLVLDLANSAVRDYLFGAIDSLLREAPISYLKWDHNRDLAPAGGWAQVQGTYALLARLRAAHPLVEIESCAGGGGRSDAGMAAYTHRFWTSDNIDAVSRVTMQRGFLNFLPPEVMGSHVGASPAHATGRTQSLGFRAAIALQGHFGVELDPRALTAPEQAELADWIAFYKSWRKVLHGGWVQQGEGADGVVWQAQGAGNDFLLFAIRTNPAQDRRPQPMVLPFLQPFKACSVQLLRIAGCDDQQLARIPDLHQTMLTAPISWPGTWLAHAGLPMPPLPAECVAIFHGVITP